MESQIYKDIVTKLQGDVLELKWIDMDAGQLEMPEEYYPVQFPAVFIDFPNIDWNDASRGLQNGVVDVSVRIALDIMEDFHGEAPDLDAAIAKLGVKTKVHQAINRMSGEHYNRLVRYKTVPDKRADGLKVWTIYYRCALLDPGMLPEYNDITVPGLNVSPEPERESANQ